MPYLQVINLTPHTVMTTYEIVRDLLTLKFIRMNVLPCTPQINSPAVTLHTGSSPNRILTFLKG